MEAGPLMRSSYHADQTWAAIAAGDASHVRGTRRPRPTKD